MTQFVRVKCSMGLARLRLQRASIKLENISSAQKHKRPDVCRVSMGVGLVLNPVTGCLIISNAQTKVIRLRGAVWMRMVCKSLACDVEKWKEHALRSKKKKSQLTNIV